jgi:hypothetical protein
VINTNAYDFTFTIRSFGSDPDEAFQLLQDLVVNDLSILFTNVVSYEKVPKDEAKREIEDIVTESIEEVLLSTPDAEA